MQASLLQHHRYAPGTQLCQEYRRAAHCTALLGRLVFMEHQSSDLDTLPRRGIHRLRIDKGGMWNPPGTTVEFGIEALDQNHLFGRLSVQVVPFMFRIRTDGVRLAPTVRVDQIHAHKVRVRHRVGVRDGERIFIDGLDGSPDVDDLIAGLEQLVRLVWKMVRDSGLGCAVALVDVHSIHRPAEVDGRSLAALVLGLTADGVVEDEHARSTGSVW